ncbi:MAG: class I SAM-dependent methyltransferase [Acidobacteriota bacterium]|nr:class I SAM-dependent methyltransferase [Acidobacteriota bacterium]
MFDFVDSADRAEEKGFYDQAYVGRRQESCAKQTVESVLPIWDLPDRPENRIVLEQLGDLSGKKVLLLGNGESLKELLFLTMDPAHLVYSDLSTHALMNICDRFELDQFQNQLTFAAIDAHDIPFSSNTFDVIYGFAMVHHLPDLDRFLVSVNRALKPGGYTVFMDDAYAPIWHYSKQTWLKPLMKLSHKKTGISPEDYRFSMSGGFREVDLGKKIRRAGGEPWFVRAAFFNYLFYRGAEKLLPQRLNRMLRKETISKAVRVLDRWLCKLPLLRRNQIRLIWGFTKRP